MSIPRIAPIPVSFAAADGSDAVMLMMPDSTCELRVNGMWLATLMSERTTMFVSPSWKEKDAFAFLRSFISQVWDKPRRRISKRTVAAHMTSDNIVSRW